MEMDHLERGSRFSKRRPPILRNLAIAAAAFLFIAGERSAPPQPSAATRSDHRTTDGAKASPRAAVPQPAAPGDGMALNPVPCAFLKSQKHSPNAASLVPTSGELRKKLDDLRNDLHAQIRADVGDYDGAQKVEKDWFYALTGLAVILGAVASFLVAVDFQQRRVDGQVVSSQWRKMVVIGFQIGATTVTGAAATFKLAEMWQTRVDGRYQLLNLDSELVVGGCSTDTFGRLLRQVNLIEAEEYDLRGIFSPATSQNTSTDQSSEEPEEDAGLTPPQETSSPDTSSQGDASGAAP